MYSLLIFSLFFCLISTVFARDWEYHKVPGAKCGDGLDYKLIIDKKNSKKLAIEFMGGGACWDASTCYGPNLRTWIHPKLDLKYFSVLVKESSFLKDHTVVYLPYCTGDVFAGNHTAEYKYGLKVYHQGHQNVSKSLDFLIEKGMIDQKAVDDLVIFGSSAGGIGALVHMDTMNKYFKKTKSKVIISDSPGLHFGESFWNKFPAEMIHDFDTNFKKVGLDIDFSTGMVAHKIKDVCEQNRDWKIGILQSTKDIVMSSVFGNISPSNHSDHVLGPDGLAKSVQGLRNCDAWIIDSYLHTFLLLKSTAIIKFPQELERERGSAFEFANKMYNSSVGIH